MKNQEEIRNTKYEIRINQSRLAGEINRISKITKGRLHGAYGGLTIIDGKNKFLIPGLWDMHTHNWNSGYFFNLLLTNGITGIRDMFMEWDSLKLWKEQSASGKFNYPVIYACGPIVDGPKPMWPG